MSANLIWIVEGITAATLILTAVIFVSLPSFSPRPEIFFAVTVAAAFRQTAEASDIVRRFRRDILVHTLVAFAVAVAAGQFAPILAPIGGILWQLGGLFFAYSRARRQVLQHAAMPSLVREAVLRRRGVHLPGGWLVQAGPFLMLGAMAVYLRMHWSEIPARFVVHWGIDGRPNGWATRSAGGVFFPLILGAAICLLFIVINVAISGARSVRGDLTDIESEDKFRGVLLLTLAGMEYFMAILFSAIALMPLRQRPDAAPPVAAIVVPIFALIGFSTVLLFRAARKRNLAAEAAAARRAPGTPPMGDQTLDQYWRVGGLIYMNPDDPALLVEKRFGIGYTFNFGNPRAWITLGATLAFIIGALLLPMLMK
jgi:uncharacterized membrane protein